MAEPDQRIAAVDARGVCRAVQKERDLTRRCNRTGPHARSCNDEGDMTWTDDRHFSATFDDIDGRWDFTIRDRSAWCIFPRLGMRRVQGDSA
ncbi:hypothetical protein WT55_22090 [Burkholderia pseudomultivorans]|nr:hypothetical protein WT55_22090 [Burkholderia pseudomultivorans]